jgi:hypothetical protein
MLGSAADDRFVMFPGITIMLDPNGKALMTRDMELIRRILLEIGSWKDIEPHAIEIDEPDKIKLFRHIEMLHKQGMLEIEGNIHRSTSTGHIDRVLVKDMSWDGHDLIASLGNKTVWSKIKKSFSEEDLISMPLSVLKDVGVGLLKSWAMKEVGLGGGP